MTATHEQIVHKFLERQATRTINLDSGMIVVSRDTYINGIPVHVDHDYYQGWLIEVVERLGGQVSYVAIVAFHGPKMMYDCDCRSTPPPDLCESSFKGRCEAKGWMERWDHDSMWYEPNCGTFFDRTDAADPIEVGQWAMGVIYEMMTSYSERKIT